MPRTQQHEEKNGRDPISHVCVIVFVCPREPPQACIFPKWPQTPQIGEKRKPSLVNWLKLISCFIIVLLCCPFSPFAPSTVTTSRTLPQSTMETETWQLLLATDGLHQDCLKAVRMFCGPGWARGCANSVEKSPEKLPEFYMSFEIIITMTFRVSRFRCTNNWEVCKCCRIQEVQ